MANTSYEIEFRLLLRTATTTDSYLAIGTALLIMGASPSGTFGVTLASEINASAVTIKAGSFLRYRTV